MTLFNETLKQIQEKYMPILDMPEEWAYDTTPIKLSPDKLSYVGLGDFDEDEYEEQGLDYEPEGLNIAEAFERFRTWGGDNHTYVIYNDEGPLGCFTYTTLYYNKQIYELLPHKLKVDDLKQGGYLKSKFDQSKEMVSEIMLVGFKQNSITLVKDVLQIMDELVKKYTIVSWSVDDGNDIKKLYDKMIKNKYHGWSWHSQGLSFKTYYLIVDGFAFAFLN